MKNRSLYILLVLVVVTVFINSCKKEDQSNINNLFTTGYWQLASVQRVHYVGDSKLKTDTLNATCDTTQLFTFNKDFTCTYTNFNCKDQPTATGTWELSRDKLFLSANMICQDTTKVGSSKPFINAQINNLGQYSLVLETGDISPYYTTTQVRVITRYGFIRQRTAAK